MNEKEYIEKSELIENLNIFAPEHYTNLINQLIVKHPAAEVREVKHGYWLLLDECSNEGVYCSVCSKKVYKKEYANQKIKSKYCPNCGAIMDLVKDNSTENARLSALIADYEVKSESLPFYIGSLSEYLLSNGAILPPVVIGQKVYTILGQKKHPKEWEVIGVWHSKDVEHSSFHVCWYKDKNNFATAAFNYNDIGKTVFLSEAEAMQKFSHKV